MAVNRSFRNEYRDLKVLHEHDHASVNVIAVHGLSADPVTTWIDKSDKDKTWNWLEKQLVEVIPEARVWTFGYNSSWYGEESVTGSLSQVAAKLLDAIQENKSFLSTPLIFVAHSFGGIVVLKALLLAEDPDNDWSDNGKAFGLFQRTDAILFFGTPFYGIHEWFQKDLPKLIKEQHFSVNKDIMKTFRVGNEGLAELTQGFRNKCVKYKRPNVGCLRETQVSNVGKIVGDEGIRKIMLVTADSATIQGPSAGDARVISRDLERNHFNLHNFGEDDTRFNTVAFVLSRIVPKSLRSPVGDIVQAVLNEDMERIKLILESNRSAISNTNSAGQTPLHLASRKGNFNIAMYLLEYQANANTSDDHGQTPLHCAVISESPMLVRLLSRFGADPDATDHQGRRPEDYAHPEHEIKWILDVGHDLEAENTEKKTALVHFAEQGNCHAVISLLDQGADMKAQDYNENEPLSLAAENGHRSVALELLKRGANKEHRNVQGGTALLTSSRCGQLETVRLLLSQGADVGVHNKDGFTALTWAAFGGHLAVLILLLDEGHADINEYNMYGMTALCEACLHGHESVARALLDRGASLEAQTSQNRTPVGEARDHPAILRLVQEAERKWR